MTVGCSRPLRECLGVPLPPLLRRGVPLPTSPLPLLPPDLRELQHKIETLVQSIMYRKLIILHKQYI